MNSKAKKESWLPPIVAAALQCLCCRFSRQARQSSKSDGEPASDFRLPTSAFGLPLSAFSLPPSAFHLLGYAAMMALLVLSIVFYQERAFLLDIAFQTFLMINEGTVQVMVNRFGSAVVQSLPLLAIKAEAPIWVISMLYSASFPLFFLLIYTLIVRVFKNDLLGWALVFLFTLIVYDAFYWATSEQQQGLAVLLLYFAFLLRFPALDKWWLWLFHLGGITLLAFYHPLIFIPFYFLWVFFLLHYTKRFFNWRYLLLAVLMAAVLILKSRYFSNWYDSGKTATFMENLERYYPNYFDLPSHTRFIKNCLYYWYLFPIFLCVNLAFYAFKRQWLKLLLLLGICFGHLMLLHIASPQSEHRFYVEVNYMPLAIYVMVPFLFDIAPKVKPAYLLVLFASLLLLRLGTIAAHHRPYTARIEWVRNTMEKGMEQHPEHSRFYLSANEAPMDTLLMSWGIPYESLLISAYDGKEPVSALFIHSDIERFKAGLQQDSTLVTEFKVYDVEELNWGYFPVQVGSYEAIELGVLK